MMTLIMPSARPVSVPGRSCRWMSACAASHVTRGSTEMSLQPSFMASVTQWPMKKSGLEMVGLQPHTMVHSGQTHSGSA